MHPKSAARVLVWACLALYMWFSLCWSNEQCPGRWQIPWWQTCGCGVPSSRQTFLSLRLRKPTNRVFAFCVHSGKTSCRSDVSPLVAPWMPLYFQTEGRAVTPISSLSKTYDIVAFFVCCEINTEELFVPSTSSQDIILDWLELVEKNSLKCFYIKFIGSSFKPPCFSLPVGETLVKAWNLSHKGVGQLVALTCRWTRAFVCLDCHKLTSLLPQLLGVWQ